MLPTEINDNLRRSVIGQVESLRYVSVAIFKHLQGEPFGNLMLIGSSGTGKTTIMRAVERFYAAHDEFQKYRVVVILNANTFANDEGVIDTSRLFLRLEQRARQILGDDADPDEIGLYMQHATVCLDEVDKVSSVVGGKPYVTGINIQQALLTMIEGETIDHTMKIKRNGKVESITAHIDTGHMLFFCGGAFEALYEQVFKRVTSPTSRVKLPNETVIIDGRVEIREYFTLRHHFRQEDLFDFGMVPQFLARFDNSIILEDLNATLLHRIRREACCGRGREEPPHRGPRTEGRLRSDHQTVRVRPVLPRRGPAKRRSFRSGHRRGLGAPEPAASVDHSRVSDRAHAPFLGGDLFGRFWLGTAMAALFSYFTFGGTVLWPGQSGFECVILGAVCAAMLTLVGRSRFLEAAVLIPAFALLRLAFGGNLRIVISGLLLAAGAFLVALVFAHLGRRGVRFGKFLIVGPLLGGVCLALAPVSQFHALSMYDSFSPMMIQLFVGIVVGDGAGLGVELADLLPWARRFDAPPADVAVPSAGGP